MSNPNTVVVLNTSDPIFMSWVDDVKAILEMGYPGHVEVVKVYIGAGQVPAGVQMA